MVRLFVRAAKKAVEKAREPVLAGVGSCPFRTATPIAAGGILAKECDLETFLETRTPRGAFDKVQLARDRWAKV